MRSGLLPTPCSTAEPVRSIACGLLFACVLSAAPQETLVLGIAGGWEPADAPWSLTTRVNTLVEAAGVAKVRTAAISNHRLEDGKKLVLDVVDLDHDGKLSPVEAKQARIILYGQSMGGAATIKLCRWLKKRDVPVRLNVQIDSVGLRDGVVPANVRAAANLYQQDLGPIRGQSIIRAENPGRTKILGNWRYTYGKGSTFDTSEMPLLHRVVLNPHVKMEFDPAVTAKVVGLIVEALGNW